MVSKIIYIVRVFLIFLWSALCITLAFILLLLTWNRDFVLKFVTMRIWSPILFWISGVKTSVEGLENVDPTKFQVYVCNHESQMDIPAIVRLIPVPLYFILKKEIKKVPFLGWYAAAMGMVFVDRKNKNKSKESLKNAAELIKKGKNVIVYPEGTRSPDGKIKRFKKGGFVIAKASNIGIVPMAIKGSREVLPKGSMHIKKGHIKLKIGKPIPPETVEKLSLEELVQYTQNQVQELRDSM